MARPVPAFLVCAVAALGGVLWGAGARRPTGAWTVPRRLAQRMVSAHARRQTDRIQSEAFYVLSSTAASPSDRTELDPKVRLAVALARVEDRSGPLVTPRIAAQDDGVAQ